MPYAREHQLDTRMLKAGEVRALLPHSEGRGCIGGMFTASDGRAEPELVSPAFAAAARRHGAVVQHFCAATGIEIADGRVCAVASERGRIHTETVVCASDAWTSRLLRPRLLALLAVAVPARLSRPARAAPCTPGRAA